MKILLAAASAITLLACLSAAPADAATELSDPAICAQVKATTARLPGQVRAMAAELENLNYSVLATYLRGHEAEVARSVEDEQLTLIVALRTYADESERLSRAIAACAASAD